MKVSPHCHVESFLSGSTADTFISRAKALGRTHFAYTDNGLLSSMLKTYKLAKEADLKFIPGIEIYFKDRDCPILTGKKANGFRYFTTTLYCQDQEAYQELCRIVSDTKMPRIKLHDEEYQLWGWKDLCQMANRNTNIVVGGGVHCMVGKLVIGGEEDLAEKVFEKINSIFKGRTRVALTCEPWTKKWSSIVEVKYTDGTKDAILSNDLVTTNRARRIKAIDLVDKKGHETIVSKVVSGIFSEINKDIKSVKLHKGFLPLPGGDVTLKVNLALVDFASKLNVPIMATDYAYYANKEDKIVQTMILEGKDQLNPDLYMKGQDDIVKYLAAILRFGRSDIVKILTANEEWAHLFDDFSFDYEWRLAETGGDPGKQAIDIIKQNGRMKWDDPKWVARLKEELDVIAHNSKKDLTAYFLPIRDVLNHYKENGLLTGPGRGSAGGSLLCYLLGITQINPFKYDLPFNRFFSEARIMMNELPDIDVDLEDRELLVGPDGKSGYLYGKYGNKAAQISTRTTIRLKSAIKDTNRFLKGKVEDSIELFTEGLPAPPQGVPDHKYVFGFVDDDDNYIPGLLEVSEDLKKYVKERPAEWDVVKKAMGLTRSFSQHASAFVLSDVPIMDVIPTRSGNVTQYDAKAVESAKLIKYDFLVVSQLKDIRVCMDLINKKNGDKKVVGNFTHDGKDTYIWDLPELPEVFKSVWDGSTETLFQINTMSMTPKVKDILPETIMDIATIQALVRPGPMDFIDPKTGRNMVEEYVLRRKGESEPDIKELAELLPETYGIIVFQEDLTRIGKQLAGFSANEAEMLRKYMAKKNMDKLMDIKPSFIAGAMKKVSKEIAEAIWDRMVTFGRYGFSIIHAVEYAYITYACMFLKHFYPLEWWASILTNATEKEISGELWKYVKGKVLPPDINLSTDVMTVDYNTGKIRSKLGVIRGLGEKTINPLIEGRPYKDMQDFANKEVSGPALSHKLIHVGVLDSLFPQGMGLIEKLKMYEDCVQIHLFSRKIEEAKESGIKVRLTQPKEGKVPEHYLNLHPVKDAAMRKSVLPSLPIDLYSLGKRYSKAITDYEDRPSVMSPRGYKTPLVDGETLKRLDELPGEYVNDDKYFASTCFVIEAKEFDYSHRTRRALKLILDSDGYVSEKVLWPDYTSGKLLYPPELEKGSIVTVFFRKKAGKDGTNISGVVVET